MLSTILRKVFGSKNERELKNIFPLTGEIGQFEPNLKKLSDDQIQAKTGEFKNRIKRGESLDELLPEAFAVVREASVRTLGERHFDMQLTGGIVLHQGKISEMKTGEGKTLVATLPVYLNSLTGKGAHVITVNDYLAKRDSEWMGQIYRFLGLSVGVIVQGMDDEERRISYGSDVTYGTNNEFGFDYLRDNMKFRIEDYAQRELNYAIVDEVDSILVDEARTPLIISGPTEDSTDKYYKINLIIPRLRKDKDFTVDEKVKTSTLTEGGVLRVEELLKVKNLYEPNNIETLHHVNQALKAYTLFKRDVDYLVKDGQVIIVDEFTGRLMPGRRFSEGLHQALEAKEKVKVENENQTMASITFQNYFRMYNKLAGMTGTADTEAAEFHKIYNLDVVVIPTNKPMIRNDYPDVIYKTENEKFKAVVNEIKELHKKGQPALVGTLSIEKSEILAKMLKKNGVSHHVLNAKKHEKEAEIIAQAGQLGAVTISTNMAGRGTDIVLGDGVKELGGLRVIGTERHESRRIDNQLRGRSGRQGDAGSSRFYLSLDDDLLRIFGAERISSIMDRIGMEEDQPIEHKLITRAIENAQKKVESHNFDIRKHLLEYDDVMNKQREVIYSQRRTILGDADLKEIVGEMSGELTEEIISSKVDEKRFLEDEDIEEIMEAVYNQFSFRLNLDSDREDNISAYDLTELIQDETKKIYQNKEDEFSDSVMRQLEKMIMLQVVDSQWKDHLLTMDYLKEGIGLRGYGQKDPLREYQKEGFDMFMGMVSRIKEDTIRNLYRVQLRRREEVSQFELDRRQTLTFGRGEEETKKPSKREGKKIGRNDPCHCGSGKKYKKCCGS